LGGGEGKRRDDRKNTINFIRELQNQLGREKTSNTLLLQPLQNANCWCTKRAELLITAYAP